jgi:predicted acylesterase/phospholipase RssA
MNSGFPSRYVLKRGARAVLVLALCPAAPAWAETPMAERDAVPYVLTISGGVSLGAYEAGVNWALTKYLKVNKNPGGNAERKTVGVPPRLVAVTGASAGSINGLLTSIIWCVDEDRLGGSGKGSGTVASNLYRDIWVEVGLDRLLPGSSERYESADGLLSRKPFDDPLGKIRDLMREAIFERGCVIPLGITVTSEASRIVEIAGIKVNNQRHFIPMELRADERGSAAFYARPVDQLNPNYGNVIYLRPATPPGPAPDGVRYRTDVDQVIKAVLASSAFPVAFGRVGLDHCAPPAIDGSRVPETPNAGFRCAGGYSAQKATFVDGGVFDNIPLGSAKALAEEQMQSTARRLNYVFMDPDNRRARARIEKGVVDSATIGGAGDSGQTLSYDLLAQMKFLGGAVLTARNYELFKALTSGDWNSQTFYYADLLYKLMTREIGPDRGDLVVDCGAFFGELIRADAGRVDHQWKEKARHCIARESSSLDYRYQNLPGNADEFQYQRGQLVDHLAAVARKLDKKSLARQIERIKGDKFGDRRILLSSRFFPLTGSYLGAFGAFFDRPFREFDYYVGVYDGMHDIATYTCQFRRSGNSEGGSCRTGDVVRVLYEGFQIDGDENARYLFANIARQEHPDYSDEASSWHWLATIRESSPAQELAALFDVLREKSTFTDSVLEAPDFDVFIKSLKAKGYRSEQSSEYYRNIVESGREWWALPAQRAFDRLYDLEVRAEKPDHPSTLKRPLKLMSDVANHVGNGGAWYSFEQPGREAAAGMWKYLPYEIGSRIHHDRAVYLSWEPTLHIFGKELLRIKVTPWRGETSGDDAFYQLGVMYRWFGQKDRAWDIGTALDFNGSYHSRDGYDPRVLGASAHVDIYDKLRITVGAYDFRDHFAAHNVYLNVGLTDISGWFK